MAVKRYRNALIYHDFSLRTGGFSVENGRFLQVGLDEPDGEDLHGALVIPGLIDIHTHGNSGCDFCDGDYEGLVTLARFYAKNGVTSFAPASNTLPEDVLAPAFANAARLHAEKPAGCSVIRGIQMEGPFFAESKKGAQNPAHLRKPDYEMFLRLKEAAGDLAIIADVAPELPGGLEYVEKVSKLCRVSLAHTAADYDTARAAFQLGASHVTHLYNCMPSMLHRAPGVIGAACENPKVTVELIADGLHSHPAAARLAYAAFGKERICLVSDSLSCCGSPSGV